MSILLEKIMDLNCSEIDSEFLPSNAFNIPLLTPISSIAPPQGSIFLEKVGSMQKLLKGMPFIYR